MINLIRVIEYYREVCPYKLDEKDIIFDETLRPYLLSILFFVERLLYATILIIGIFVTNKSHENPTKKY